MNAPKPLPPIASSQVLRDAVKTPDDSSEQPIEQLIDLVKDYPDSSLPRWYLCLAHQAQSNNMDAERRFDELLHMRGATKELLEWKSNDLDLPKRLERFAKARFKRAKEIKNPSEKARKELQARQYVLAKEASQLSLAIRPESDDSAYYLACSEVQLGEPESALHRAESGLRQVEQAIEAIRSKQEPDPAELSELQYLLYRWRATRSLAITRLAERLRDKDSASAREALQLLPSVKNDLQRCDRFAAKKMDETGIQHEVEEIRVQAFMVWAEIDLKLGLLKEASGDLKTARDSYFRYAALSKNVNRTQELESFYQRIDAIGRRLNQESDRSAGRDPAPPAEKTANLPPKGR